MFNKFFSSLTSTVKLSQTIKLIFDSDVLSEEGKQIIKNNPILLSDETDLFLRNTMDSSDLAKDNELSTWYRIFFVHRILDSCRKQGLEKTYAEKHPKLESIFDALKKFSDVEIPFEHFPDIIKENPILLHDYTIDMLTALVKAPKKPRAVAYHQQLLELLLDCREKGIDEKFSELRQNLNNPQMLVKIASQRPITIYDLRRIIAEYSLLTHPEFINHFLEWAEFQKDPETKKNFIARHNFMKSVVDSGLEFAYSRLQSDPEETMLRDTVILFLIAESIEEACDIVRKNPCLLIDRALTMAEKVMQEIPQDQIDAIQILKSRIGLLELCQTEGVDIVYESVLFSQKHQSMAEADDMKHFNETFQLFLQEDWSDTENFLAKHKDFMENDFIAFVENAIEIASKSGQDRTATILQARLEIIYEYKSGRKLADREALDSLLDILEKFLSADGLNNMYLIAVENPALLSDSVIQRLDRVASINKDQDQGAYMYYKSRQNLLQRCRDVGVDQAFAEFELSPEDFMPKDVDDKYKEVRERVRKAMSEMDGDEYVKAMQKEVDPPLDHLDQMSEVLRMFVSLQSEREIAMAILENPSLFSENVDAILTNYMNKSKNSNEKSLIAKKISLLQDCKKNGVRETLSKYLS